MNVRIPLVEEQAQIGKQRVETGQVHVRKQVVEHAQEVDVLLDREDVEVERVVVNRAVDRIESPRQEGDVMIVPVHAEVVTTQLVVTEELHIRKRRSTVRERGEILLRREELDVTRRDAASSHSERPANGAGEAAGTTAPD